MVIEDHAFQRRVAVRLLADLGVTNILEGTDGLHALDVLRSQPYSQDIVLVDLDMPGMDGIECIGYIAHDQLAKAVVVVSALEPALLHTVQTMARAYGLRVLGCVEKPLTREKLESLLMQLEQPAIAPTQEMLVEYSTSTLIEALQKGEVVPWFQPQVQFSSGKVVAVEALARWERSDGSVVSPGQFMPELEREELASVLCEHMLKEGCKWLQQWEKEGYAFKLSVNMSPHVLTDSSIADRYLAIVEGYGIKPERIVLELTESALIENAARGLGLLARFRLKGFGLSIDDFGTGYSSLALLLKAPFTELKIDKAFVLAAHDEPRKRAVVEASLDLARKLELITVAEGVESPREWTLLENLGCDLAQGWLVSKPVPGHQLLAEISKWSRPAAC